MCAIIAILACATHARAIDTYNYRGVCPYPNGGKKIHDKWNFWECECTSYAADKLNERGVPFSWAYKNARWGGAVNWVNAAIQTRTPYNKTPRRALPRAARLYVH